MTAIPTEAPPLVAGDFLSRAEFLRRWEAMPHVRFAELIHGIVYMPSPLSLPHGEWDSDVGTWLGCFRAATPGCRAAANTTWLMSEDSAPQPDTSLRILPECGGQSRVEGNYPAGAPEFLAEVCLSSTAYDLNQKLALYEEAGVCEYLAVLVREREARWHRRDQGRLVVVPLPADGIHRSAVFPGLWLDAAALIDGDLARVLAVLQQGTATPEHAAFVAELAARRQP